MQERDGLTNMTNRFGVPANSVKEFDAIPVSTYFRSRKADPPSLPGVGFHSVNIPFRGYRESGSMETVNPGLRKPGKCGGAAKAVSRRRSLHSREGLTRHIGEKGGESPPC